MKKKIMAILLGSTMAAGLLAGCGSSSSSGSSSAAAADAALGSAETTTAAAAETIEDTSAAASTAETAATEATQTMTSGAYTPPEEPTEPITLTAYGPGLFTSQGEDGKLDLITGIETPGYKTIVEDWEKIHPNVSINLQAIPWDSWQSAIQTAVLGGDVDIILHGGSLTALDEPLEPYLEADPDFESKIYAKTYRRIDGTLDQLSITAIPYSINPVVVLLDKQIFKDYGVGLPNSSWTWDDLIKAGQKMTGTDPVTGKETYGLYTEPGGNAHFLYIYLAGSYDVTNITYGKTVKDSAIDYTNDDTLKVFEKIKEFGKALDPLVKEGTGDFSITADNNVAIRLMQGTYSHYNEINVAGLNDRFTYVTLPVVEAGENTGKPYGFLGDSNMAICNTSSHTDWAWEFIKFMVTNRAATQWVADTYNIPNSREFVKNLDSVIPAEYSDAIKGQLDSLAPDYTNAATAYYNAANFGTLSSDIDTAVQNVWSGAQEPEEAMQELQSKVDDFMKAQ